LRIVIDPGMAFGTGSHETTAMCLARLKALLKPGDRALDTGTGSGVLAIAAALLGAEHVDAVEIDADASASAAGNIAANNVADKVTLIEGDAAEQGVLSEGARYDLIAANLSLSLLEKLLPVLERAMTDGGAMILSGLLDSREDGAIATLERVGLKAVDILKTGEWLMIEAGRRQSCDMNGAGK
jgi:ribosomal protein L11 methyltransferase